MGMNLTLLPFDGDHSEWGFSHTVLECERDYEIFDQLREEPQMRVPDIFRSYLSQDDKYEELHYGNTQETPYGEPLTFVELESVLKYKPFARDRNAAIWAYLEHLPARTKVALYWH